MLVNVTSSQFINRHQPTSLNKVTTTESCSSSPLFTEKSTITCSIGTESTITTKYRNSLTNSCHGLSYAEYCAPSSHNYTSIPRSLTASASSSSSVKSNITTDVWLTSTSKALYLTPTPTMQPSTTELTTPPSTKFASTITTFESYTMFTSKKSIYVVYEQEYEITESTTSFSTHFPQTTRLKETNAPLTFTIPCSTITGDAKLYRQLLPGALDTQNASDKDNNNTGVIVGSTVGIIIGVVIVIFIGFVVIRNKRNVKTRSKNGFSHDIGKRVGHDEVMKGEPMLNPFRNEFDFKARATSESTQDLFGDGREIRRSDYLESAYAAHPYYGMEDHDTRRLSYLSSLNESTGSSIGETSSNASTITRPNIDQTNSFLREII
ncbi:hypothetical protein SEUBUCD646_0D00440 [Saccharomyces eubayanus]|uniref:Uncharacterized protein n=2 Tax=Saccharomyces TaxID=4930 RepID=A0A6C1E4T3_SACPS|nr:hypothetical protein GRS66_006499 [Saccharomyces pastorianus]CAI1887421.1 hypothetical protein SEUBUCD650_0D00430 [Saccharomyces eubayanus]CAI1921085.1 hypothetical protein SEUBUCD646_0D00440 [Saccharomyces eubayanus]